MTIKEVLAKFHELFGTEGEIRTFFSPGRVNLMGDHTDYNRGYNFSCAVTYGTYGAIRKRDDRKLRFYSINFEGAGVREDSLDNFRPLKDRGWANYMKGVMWTFDQNGCHMDTGCDIVIGGDIPPFSGLSSSGSLEVLTGFMLREIYGFAEITDVDIAKFANYAECHYTGANSTITEQYACAMGRAENALLVDTKRLSCQYAPLKLGDNQIVLTNSMVKHRIAGPTIEERFRECQAALKKIQTVINVDSLCALSVDQFNSVKDVIMDETLTKRARHVVYESQRTIQAVSALRANNLARFADLMTASHKSLRDDYEISCDEINLLVDLAVEIPGVLCSRITGAGFGGCTVSIVSNDAIPDFIKTISRSYRKQTRNKAEFYIVEIVDGARQLTLEN
ncbi:MAG: galactokinase [Lachnospiraceae bacterium]|nr:galactokinase [Lachnospiraceae bacterium]